MLADLTTYAEDGTSGLPQQANNIKVLSVNEEGKVQEVAYQDLDARMQENVLTDLLVKSAISQALKRQEVGTAD